MFWIFYIVLFLSMLSQAVVFNKIFNLLYKQLIFIQCFRSEKSIWFQDDKLQSQMYPQASYLAEIDGRLM